MFTVPIRIDAAGQDAAIHRVTTELDRMERAGKAAGEIVSKALGAGRLHADQAAEATRRYTQELIAAERAAERAAAAVGKIQAPKGLFDGAGAGILSGAGLAGGMAGIAAVATTKVIDLGRSVVELGESYTNLDNRLRSIAPIEATRLDLMEKTRAVANASRSDWAATNELFVRLSSSTKEMGVSQERVLGLTETISKTFAKSGASSQEAAAGMLQLSQAFASGKLQGDEFKSLSESVPDVLDLIAKQMGVTRGELKQLSSEGKITGDVLVATFENAKGQIDSGFAKTAPTLSQSFTQFKNDMTATFGPLLQDLLPRVAAKMQEVAAHVSTIVDKAKSVGGGLSTAVNAEVGGISVGDVFGAARSAFNPADQAQKLDQLHALNRQEIEDKKEAMYLYVQMQKTGKDWVNILIDEAQELVKTGTEWGRYKQQVEGFLATTRVLADPSTPKKSTDAWRAVGALLGQTMNDAGTAVDNLLAKLNLLESDGTKLVRGLFGDKGVAILGELSAAGEKAEGGWAMTRRDPNDPTDRKKGGGGRARAKATDTWADAYVSQTLTTIDQGIADIQFRLELFNEWRDRSVFELAQGTAGTGGLGSAAANDNASFARDPNFLKPANDANRDRLTTAHRLEEQLKRNTEQWKSFEEIGKSVLGNVENAFVKLATTGEFSFKGMMDSIMADLTRMATHRLMMSLFGAIMGPGAGIQWANGATSAYPGGYAHGGVFHAAHGLRIGGSSTVGDKVPFMAMVNSGETVDIRSRFQQQEQRAAAPSGPRKIEITDNRRDLTVQQREDEIARVMVKKRHLLGR